MIENREEQERVILVAVAGTDADNDIDTVRDSLSELFLLQNIQQSIRDC